MPRKIEQLDADERSVLDDIGRYRLGFSEANAVLADLENKASAKSILERLTAKGLLIKHDKKNALAKNCPYWTLSPSGASFLKLNRERAGVKGTNALSTHLSILWFASSGAEQSQIMRVESKSVNEALGATFHHNVQFCAAKKDGRVIVYRIYRPNTNLHSIASWLVDFLHNIPSNLKEAVGQGCLGVAILVESKESIEGIRKHLSRSSKGELSLLQRVRVELAVGASSATFPTEYKRLSGNAREN